MKSKDCCRGILLTDNRINGEGFAQGEEICGGLRGGYAKAVFSVANSRLRFVLAASVSGAKLI